MSPGGFDMEFIHSEGSDLWHFFNKYYWSGIIAFVHREDDHLVGDDGLGKWLVSAFSTSEPSFNFYIHPSFLSEYSSARWFPLVAGLIPLCGRLSERGYKPLSKRRQLSPAIYLSQRSIWSSYFQLCARLEWASSQ